MTLRFATLILAIVLLVAGCKKPATPPPPSKPTPVVLTVCGLGSSQLSDVVMGLTYVKDFQTVDMGSPDGYRADIQGYANSIPNDIRAAVGHSAAGGALCRAALTCPKLKHLVLLDPALDSDITIPAGVDCLVIVADPTPFITQSRVHGLFREVHSPYSHNIFLHHPEVVAMVIAEVAR